jgi:hypothetical protein
LKRKVPGWPKKPKETAGCHPSLATHGPEATRWWKYMPQRVGRLGFTSIGGYFVRSTYCGDSTTWPYLPRFLFATKKHGKAITVIHGFAPNVFLKIR